MNLELMKKGLTRGVVRAGLYVQKYSPEILTGAGLIGMVTTVVVASKATLKLPDITEDLDLRRESINIKAKKDLEYAKNEYKSDLRSAYAQTTWDIVKLYAPTFFLTAGTAACFLGSYGILRKRNAALAAAYVALDKAYRDYRERVAAKWGEEEEQRIYLNETTEEAVGEDGKPMALTKITGQGNPYGRWFDEGSPQWSNEPGHNLRTLLTEQNWLNDRLKSRGYVFLNEVYRRLGLPETPEGQLVGWWYNRENPEDNEGDDYIDFRMYDPNSPGARDFINGYNKSIFLDFNVQGAIFENLGDGKRKRLH